MTRPRLLDLFCGAGGAAMGYQRAGFYVVGVDLVDQPRYAGDEFHRADALTFPLDAGHPPPATSGDTQMHDPMVVAHEIPSPVPHRARWRERKGRRWGFDVSRRTNEENLGQRTYPWWRPRGYTLKLAGRAYELGRLATIWHVEPGERDAFEVCKHASKWKWHVHHWKLQVHALQGLRARLFDRCAECGRKGRPNISYQWDGKRLGWWKFRSREGLYHRECSDLGQLRNQRTTDEDLIRFLFAAYRLGVDMGEEEALARLTDPKTGGLEFRLSYRLTHMLGYERGDNYELVRAERGGR